MAYTKVDGKVVPVWTVQLKAATSYSVNRTEETVSKVSELKQAMHELLMAKKHLMGLDERMEFLKINEKLCSWITKGDTAIEDVILRSIKVLASYGKSSPM